MSSAKALQLVLVTPETTLLDEPVQAIRIPLFDGAIGILPGRAPMVGRLGYGELRISNATGERSYFVDGGFVQVKGFVVSILTNRSMPSDRLDAAGAREQLQRALKLVPVTDETFSLKDREQERARRMLALAAKSR